MPDAAVRYRAHWRLCPDCGCRLSRYNRGERCALCARHAGEPIATVSPHVWGEAQVQAAIEARDFGLLCRLVRQHGNLRQEDLASLTGLSQAFLSMLESGARRLTHIDRIAQLVTALDIPVDIASRMLFPALRDEGLPDGRTQ